MYGVQNTENLPSGTLASSRQNRSKFTFSPKQHVNAVHSALHRRSHFASDMTEVRIIGVNFHAIQSARRPVIKTSLQSTKSAFSMNVSSTFCEVGV